MMKTNGHLKVFYVITDKQIETDIIASNQHLLEVLTDEDKNNILKHCEEINTIIAKRYLEEE